VDKGTSGKNMTYKMVVSLMPPIGGAAYNFVNIGSAINYAGNTGCDKIDSTSYGDAGPNRYVIDNIFNAQGGASDMTAATTISVLEKIKTKNPDFTIDDFSKKRIVVAIIGESNEAGAQGTHHPIIAIDDIQVSYWIDWYKTINGGLYTSIGKTAVSSTKVIGKVGQIQILDAQAAGTIYNITGQKVADFAAGNQNLDVKSGIYMVVEKNQPTQKVIVK
jgi:hypothetical protein